MALAGDLVLVSDKLRTLPGLLELGQHISDLYKRAEKFRDARHFFSHMDEALRDYSKHAIHVPHTLDCGVTFTANATNNTYLIWENNTLYFSYDHRPCQVDIDRPEFNEIFNLARELYAKIIDNPISQKFLEFRRPEQVYTP